MLMEEMNKVEAPLSDAEAVAVQGAVVGIAFLVIIGAISLC